MGYQKLARPWANGVLDGFKHRGRSGTDYKCRYKFCFVNFGDALLEIKVGYSPPYAGLFAARWPRLSFHRYSMNLVDASDNIHYFNYSFA